MKIKLSNYLNSRVMEVENDEGDKEKGLFIPIDINGLYLSPRNQVIGWAFVTEKDDESDGYSHYIKAKPDMKHVEKINDLGYRIPYIGSMRHSYYKAGYQIDKEKRLNEKVQNIE